MGEAEDAPRDDDANGVDGAREEETSETEVDAEPSPRPKRKKRKKKRKRRAKKDRAEEGKTSGEPERRRPWWALLLVIGLIELFLFGSRGRMRVCVAHEGEHDFALVDQPRTEENTRRYPTCVKRTNVGIVSEYDDVRTEATGYACQRAAVLRPTSVLYQCILEQDGWQHRVETSFVPPWDPIYYRRLFWFAYD